MKIFVPDTNLLLYGKFITDINWGSILEDKEICILLSYRVLKELDDAKYSKKRARKLIAFFKNYDRNEKLQKIIPLVISYKKTQWTSLPSNFRDLLDKYEADHHILAEIINKFLDQLENVYLITADYTLLKYAEELGLNCIDWQEGDNYKEIFNYDEERKELTPKLIKLTPKKKEEVPNKLYDANFKVIIFSELGRHKTAFTERYLISNRSDYEKSLGVKFLIKNLVIDKFKKIKLNIFSLRNETEHRFSIPSYVRGASGALFLYDVNRESTLLRFDEWLHIFKTYSKKTSPVVVVGVIFGPERKRQVDFEESKKFVESKGMDGLLECNVQTGENVDKVFDTLARLMLKKQSGIVSLKELFNST